MSEAVCAGLESITGTSRAGSTQPPLGVCSNLTTGQSVRSRLFGRSPPRRALRSMTRFILPASAAWAAIRLPMANGTRRWPSSTERLND